MKYTYLACFLGLILAVSSAAGFEDFARCEKGSIVDKNGPIRFVSFNIPCLHYNEDYLPFTEINPWRLPNEYEITDALEAVRQMGGTVVRIYSLSVRQADDDPEIIRHIIGPGQFDDRAFEPMDKLLEVANQKGIRVIIPFIDNWKWWGGIEACAAFRGKSKDEFWTDELLFEDYKRMVSYLVNRTNIYTGQKYRDDKAILAWETGNELVCPHKWTQKAAAFIKSIDQNHLVLDGYHTTDLRKESIEDENIDFVTSHHYVSNANETVRKIKQNAQMVGNKKPYFVGEFGFLDTDDIEKILDAVIHNDVSGALIWSLRYRNRDGGFYWHSEPAGGNLYKAYHWPGFPTGNTYDEKNLLALMRNKAFEIQNLNIPAIEKPFAPRLLEIKTPAAISWQSAAGTQTCNVQRSRTPNGPWQTVGSDIDDTWVQYRPLFNDESIVPGHEYYYRIIAKNHSGLSQPSNIVGPVSAKHRTLVDEFANLDRIDRQKGKLEIRSDHCRKFKEDIHRLAGEKNSEIIYQLSEPIDSVKLWAFFPGRIRDFEFSVSKDGKKYDRIPIRRNEYFSGTGDYGYYKPVEFIAEGLETDAQYLKITFTEKAQLSRLEIGYDPLPNPFSHTKSPTGFIKAFSWGWSGWRGQYSGDGPVESMKKLAQTGANWVCITFAGEVETFDSPDILYSDRNSRMVTDDEIFRAIRLARENNLKVILKPVVNSRDTTWRAWIKFNKENGKKDLEKWDQWWTNFNQFLQYYAKIAEDTGCEMLCLGCEMESTEEFEGQWRNMIRDIRKIYSGAITYNANHGREEKISWWDAVDIIGMSGYYPVGTDNVGLALQDDLSKVPPSNSSVKALKKRWQPIKNRLEKVSKKFDRPIFFIEIGVCSAKGYTAAPWTHHDPNAEYDAQEQKRFYQATFETFWDEPWFFGFAWWAWLPNLYSVEEAQSHTGFSVYGKPAEEVVRQWYHKPR